MTRCACGTAVALLLLSLVSPVQGQQYLYSPTPVGPEETAPAKDGVLVREVPVEKGDTLSGISRKYSGHGSYYSQILLFNDIKNPNLIYSGDTLKVPVTREQGAEEARTVAPAQKEKGAARPGKKARRHHAKAAPKPAKQHAARQAGKPATELSLDELKRLEGGKEKRHPAKRRVAEGTHGGGKPAKAPVAREAVAVQSRPAVAAREGQQKVTATAPSGQRLFEQAVKAYRQEECRAALDLFDRFLAENPASPQAADASLYKAECYMKLSAQ